MNQTFSIAIILMCWILTGCDKGADKNSIVDVPVEATFMTYNIRIISVDDVASGDGWEERKGDVLAIINDYSPDFLGLQEDLIPQQAYLTDKLKENYASIDGNIDLTKARNTIFFNKSAYKLLKARQFFLSENGNNTPGWDANQTRMCVYGLFQHKATGKTIHVLNTHFDHIGAEARKNSALLVIEKIKAFTDGDSSAPIIFMGDLNASASSSNPNTKAVHEHLKSYLSDALDISATALQGPKGTFSGFDGTNVAVNRIDFIYTRNMTVGTYQHIDRKRSNGRYPSDHIPVEAKVVF